MVFLEENGGNGGNGVIVQKFLDGKVIQMNLRLVVHLYNC
jgi:hypothetical protein